MALITGGTSGIGLALAMGFAEERYEVLSAGLGEMPENQDLNVSFCQSVVRVLTRFNPYFGPLSDYDRVNNANLGKESIGIRD